MTYVAILVLILLIASLISRHGLSAAAHPALWFSFSWLAAYCAYYAIYFVGSVPVTSEDAMNSLAGMITTIGFAFLLFHQLIRGSRTQFSKYNAPGIRMPLAIFISIGLIGATINWLVLGANIGYSDENRQEWLYQTPVVTARTWYLYIFSYPAAFACGWIISLKLLNLRNLKKTEYLYIAVPFIAGLLWSLGTGGRQALGIIILYYAAGAVICISYCKMSSIKNTARAVTKSFLAVSAIVIIFSLFIGITGLSRAEQQMTRASSFDEIPVLAPFGQFIEYLGMPIAVHQAYKEPLQRDLSETGPVTIAGLFMFGSRDLMGWREIEIQDTNPERFMDYSAQHYKYGTRNVFYDMQEDFGYVGTILLLLIFALLSHLVFIYRKTIESRVYLVRFIPLAMLLMFWGYSSQFSLLIHDTLFWMIISFTLWDIAGLVLSNYKLNIQN